VSSRFSKLSNVSRGIDRYRQDESDIQIRDGLIQRFEFAYELTHKMLKRYLESNSDIQLSLIKWHLQILFFTGMSKYYWLVIGVSGKNSKKCVVQLAMLMTKILQ
jgi:hypothetical protein